MTPTVMNCNGLYMKRYYATLATIIRLVDKEWSCLAIKIRSCFVLSSIFLKMLFYQDNT